MGTTCIILQVDPIDKLCFTYNHELVQTANILKVYHNTTMM